MKATLRDTIKKLDTTTLDSFALRSDRAVTWITFVFAAGPALLGIIFLPLTRGAGTSGIFTFWSLWVPLCFVTIPPIHFLCRRVRELEKQIDAIVQKTPEDRKSA